MTQRPVDTAGMELNAYWKSQQPKQDNTKKTDGLSMQRIPINLIDIGRPKNVPPQAKADIEKRIRGNTEKPILVRQNGTRFTLIDGSIRVQVYRSFELTDIPAIIEGFVPPVGQPPAPQQQPPVPPIPKKEKKVQPEPPAVCTDCLARPDCKKVIALWHGQAPRPDLARAWCALIDSHARDMICLSGRVKEP